LTRYFESRFVIDDRTTAEFLQNRNNWEIANALIDAGIEGMTSQELAKKLNIGYKVVADTMKHLAQMGWITSERPKPRVGRPAKGIQRRDFRKPPYLHVWKYFDSFEPIPREDFEDYCTRILDKHAGDFRQFISLIDGIVDEMKSSAEFYPKESVIHECGWNHEGYEFIKGFLYAFLNWLESNAEFQTLLKKSKFATDKAFEDYLPTTAKSS
jgi:hypothetical protein